MQATEIIQDAGKILGQAAQHRTGLIAALIPVVTALSWLAWWVRRHRPRDLTGNGIAIGQAKAFDSSSLTLRLQRLNAGLEALKVVNQNITENLSTVQERSSTETHGSLSLNISASDHKGATRKGISEGNKEAGTDAKTEPGTEPKETIRLGAGDTLANQLNLASQIFNLQTLYEGSLSDRMLGQESRLQTVLGFQVSISPPAGYQDCVAIVEMAVWAKQIPASPPNPAIPSRPVSLVALMPQEKTYTAQSTMTVEQSVDGSAAVRLLTLGLGGRRASRGAFIRRDPETVAFERKQGESPQVLDNATTFGWEFRPDLGRRAVSPGPRQLMAVIAVPASDSAQSAEVVLEVATRSYWREYDRKKQTSGPAMSWLPWHVDRSGALTSTVQELAIPNTAKIQVDEEWGQVSSCYHWHCCGPGRIGTDEFGLRSP